MAMPISAEAKAKENRKEMDLLSRMHIMADRSREKVRTVTPQLVPRHNCMVPPDHLRQIMLPQMVPPDQVWLPWMIRFAASGPPLVSRFKVDKSHTDRTK